MTRARGREKGFRMSEEHRVKIKNSNILNALIEHVEGKREMKTTQVTAAIALLDRVLPKLQSVEVTGDEDNPVSVITKIELVAAGAVNTN